MEHQVNNPVKDRTPREGNNWWMLVMVLLVALGIFWALGRSGGDRDAGPMSSPTDTYVAPPDRVDNPSRTDDAIIRDEEPIIRVENDLDPEIRIDNDLERDRDR